MGAGDADVPAVRELGVVADALERLSFGLSGTSAAELRTERDRVVRLLRGVLARSATPHAPLLVVVAGGTGAGKSTTVNSLAGRGVTATGVVRPTTRVATLVCHPQDRDWFADERVLPGLVRVEEPAAGTLRGDQLALSTSPALPAGIALVDTPDVDSVERHNRVVAERALDAADVWLWLATARTYADEVGMTYLRRARDRQALTAIAITQLRGPEDAEVLADVARVHLAEGVEPDRTVAIAHAEVVDDRLPAEVVADLNAWLTELSPAGRRERVRGDALRGLRAAVPAELTPIAHAVEHELEVADRLLARVAGRFACIGEQLDEELEAGLSLRSEVLERWRQLVGGNELLLKVQSSAEQLGGVVRDRLGLRSRDHVRQVQGEIADELTRTVERLLEQAAARVRRDLESDPVGRDLLDRHPRLRATGTEREGAVRRTITEWQAHAATLVDEVGGRRKVRARRLTTALNATATTAILVLFTVSGGLTTGEVGIAAGAAAASQWLLTRLLGEQNVKRLLEEIQADLRERVERLAAAERLPVEDVIGAAAPPAAVVATVRDTAGRRP
jgi:hypothetical protein